MCRRSNTTAVKQDNFSDGHTDGTVTVSHCAEIYKFSVCNAER